MSWPTIKLWRVTLEDGRRFELLAPTRQLARLSVRPKLKGVSIRSVGRLLARRPKVAS